MTPDLFKALLMPVVESLAERCRNLEARVAVLEASKREPLNQASNPSWYANPSAIQGWPLIDPSLMEGEKP